MIEHKGYRSFRSDRDRSSRPKRHSPKRQKQRSRRNQWSALGQGNTVSTVHAFWKGARQSESAFDFHLHAEKILKHAPVRLSFHRRQPGEIELIWPNPTHRTKFCVRSRDVHQALRPSQTQQKVMMRLPAKPFFRHAGREPIPVRTSHLADAVGIARQGNFLEHLTH